MQHPDHLNLSSQEMLDWMAFDLIEPISLGFHVDLGSALIQAMLANVNRDAQRTPEPFMPDTFMPVWENALEDVLAPVRRAPTAEELYLKAAGWAMLGVGMIEEGGAE